MTGVEKPPDLTAWRVIKLIDNLLLLVVGRQLAPFYHFTPDLLLEVFAALPFAEACGYRLFFLLFGYLAAFFYLLPDVPLKDPYGYAIAHVAPPYKQDKEYEDPEELCCCVLHVHKDSVFFVSPDARKAQSL